MQTTIKALSGFITSHRDRFKIEAGNIFATNFSQVQRYLQFLDIIEGECALLSREFIANAKAMRESLQPGTHPMSSEQAMLQEEGYKISTALHLKIESHYLFVKILLDKISRSLEFYFGPARGLSLDSHDCLERNLVKYCLEKGLSMNEKMSQLINTLKVNISDYRDYDIAHHKLPRTVYGTSFNDAGEIRIISNRLYPRASEGYPQKETRPVDETAQIVEAYILEIIEFLVSNHDKTNLERV